MLLEILPSSLEFHLRTVFPKYVSCFCNANVRGEILLGVSDNGEISGIPMYESMTHHIASTLARLWGENVMGAAKDVFSFEILPIDAPVDLEEKIRREVEDMEKLLLNYFSVKKKHINESAELRKSHAKWVTDIGVYNVKLNEIVNNMSLRAELIEFIEKWLGMEYMTYDESTLAHVVILIQLLKEYEYIHFETSHFDFQYDRDDRGKIWFWITRFKEFKIAAITRDRPKSGTLGGKNSIQVAVSTLNALRYTFMGRGVKYCVLRILIQGELHTARGGGRVNYKCPHTLKWYAKKRALDGDGRPCSTLV